MTLPVFTRGDWQDIGEGVRIRRVFCDGVIEAIDWDHQCARGPEPDYIALTPPHNWKLESAEPFTISPSLLCTACQRHGFIQNSKWVPA